MSDSTIMLPDGSELNLADLSEEELLELYHSYEIDLMNQGTDVVGTLIGGGFLTTLQSCVGPTTWQTMEMAGKLFSLCLILRIITLLKVPPNVKHLVSCGCGFLAFVIFFGEHFVLTHLFFLCGIAYGLLYYVTAYKGFIVSLFCVLFLLICELYAVGAEAWLAIKGSCMILSMKIISLAFDVEQGTVNPTPNIVEYCGYVFCPSSIIFGPFMMYRDYCQILKSHSLSMSWLVSLTRTVFLGYVFLIMSTCITPWIFPDDSNTWLLAYQTAFSFRCSNYFVGFLSESACLLCGIGTVVKEDEIEKIEWNVPISRPQHVEFPRSFAEIAVHWSIPNHVFLKNYVFKRARPLGPFFAIFVTFAASSILHGLSFSLAAVLVSIGTYAYVEHAFRKKLARIFSMCIESRKCRPDCKHMFKESNYWVTVLNLGFGFLNVFHLAYLGVMFDGNTSEDRGFGVEHTLEKWSGLNYLSHWVVLAMYLINLVL